MSRTLSWKATSTNTTGIYLDDTSLVDNSVPFDRPGMRTKKESGFIETAVPSTHNLQARITENVNIIIWCLKPSNSGN